MTSMVRRAGAAVVGAVLVVGGLAGSAGAAGGTGTERSCSVGTAKAAWYVTHPRKVRSAVAAACVLRHARTTTFTEGLTQSAHLRYRSVWVEAYHDPGGDGTDVVEYETRYRADTAAGFTLRNTHREIESWGNPEPIRYEDVTLQYFVPGTDTLFESSPVAGTGWTRSVLSEHRQDVPLLGSSWFALTTRPITRWSGRIVGGTVQWSFTSPTVTTTMTFTRGGKLLSLHRAHAVDGDSRTTDLTMTVAYGEDVPWVRVPSTVEAAATVR